MNDELTSAISFLEQELAVVESKAEALRAALGVLRAKADTGSTSAVQAPSAPKATETDEDEQIETCAPAIS
ncbi:MAG: hypothetical protein ACXU82_05115 [Caulobacteraceae bacterium]